jgi:hypothetical protein
MIELRKAPQYVLRCRAEINDWAAVNDCLLRDVSLRGCYVETTRPLSVGSEIEIFCSFLEIARSELVPSSGSCTEVLVWESSLLISGQKLRFAEADTGYRGRPQQAARLFRPVDGAVQT